MDYSLPGMDGITTSLRLLQINQNLKIIILTGLHQLPASRVVLQAGIRGYMTKSSATEEVGQAVDYGRFAGPKQSKSTRQLVTS